MKRILSLLLALCLLLSLSVGVFASEITFDYSEDDVYISEYDTAEDDGSLLLAVIIALVVALIVCFIFKAQMRSVHTQNASAYVTPKGLDLRVRTDRFTHVTRHVTRVSSSKN